MTFSFGSFRDLRHCLLLCLYVIGILNGLPLGSSNGIDLVVLLGLFSDCGGCEALLRDCRNVHGPGGAAPHAIAKVECSCLDILSQVIGQELVSNLFDRVGAKNGKFVDLLRIDRPVDP